MASDNALRVIIDGKPAAGKTTVAKSLEKSLNAHGIHALDAKTTAFEHGFFGPLLRRFEDTEISTFRDLMRSGTYHTLSYVSLEMEAWKNRKKYDVMLLQRSPSSFLFIFEAMKFEKTNKYTDPSGLLYGILGTWSRWTKPDLYIYLTVRQDLLEKRFANRKDGKDHIHRTMVMRDDTLMLKNIRNKLGIQILTIDNSRSLSSITAAIESTIKEALAHKNTMDNEATAQSRHVT